MNNKGADQTAQKCRMIFTFVVRYGINWFSNDVAHLMHMAGMDNNFFGLGAWTAIHVIFTL